MYICIYIYIYIYDKCLFKSRDDLDGLTLTGDLIYSILFYFRMV